MIALAGWAAAMFAIAAALVARRRLGERLELTARAAHELRGPLTAARLGLEPGARGEELSAARLRAIDVELARAALVLDDLVGAGSARNDEVDAQQVVADSVEAWRASAAARGVGLRIDWSPGPAYVRGDRLRLAQATANLISNAIEHGGGDVVVRGRIGHSAVRVEVIDDGPGLPAPVAELAHRPRAGRGHRGRGLAIAAGVAEAHGGRASAGDRPGGGAEFRVELPLFAGGVEGGARDGVAPAGRRAPAEAAGGTAGAGADGTMAGRGRRVADAAGR